jgi:hypothetical protein
LYAILIKYFDEILLLIISCRVLVVWSGGGSTAKTCGALVSNSNQNNV